MDQPQSRRPASASRPARRSLVEFALPASGALGEIAPVAQLLPAAQPTPAPQRGRQPLKAIDQKKKTIMHEPLRPANDLNGGAKDNALFDPFEDMTAAAAKAAKDYRSWMLEQMTINMCAALDYANGVASARTASVGRPDTPERGTTSYSQSADN